MHSKVAVLNVVNWNNSVGGEHYPIKYSYEGTYEYFIEYEMTSKQAIMFNKKDSAGSLYKKGSKTNRFWSMEKALEHAIKHIHRYHPECRLILRGLTPSDPCEVIWCSDDEIRQQLVLRYDRWEDIYSGYENYEDPWKDHAEEMNKLSSSWEFLIDKLCSTSCLL